MDKSSTSLRTIFDEASEMEDDGTRAAFVIRACGGDEALRQRVEALLRAHETAGGFLNGPGRADAPSQTIGRYKLLQKIGEGGCGTVYLAEQMEPVRRKVALKLIKLGMDTRSVIVRFEAERQALALMDHPHIAKVLDAGATEAGRPFFVMELVRGARVTAFCDQNHLSTAQRLKLFIQICQAIQHAHQKGVIHRDIKPSNVLVTLHDGVPVPKVIDFGIAKATTGQPLTDKTLFTQFDLLIGTPAYMSPEQAHMSGLDIDTRSDIYALGALLYELLTGRTPFDTQTLLKSGIDAMRRTIRETEPARPSTRLRTLAAADLTEVAKHRQSEPLKLVSLVRGDLDWIVLKALEKDRTRRYETANALAADIQRHLLDEPIVARPPGRLYVLGKMIRRNKLAFAAGAAVVGALVFGLGAATILLVREQAARRDADAARAAEVRLRGQADAEAEESRQRLVRLNVLSGNKLIEEGDAFGALLWFVEALRLDAGDAAREEIHRRRLAATWQNTPRLAQFWPHDGFVTSAEFSRDGARVVSAGLDHTARVWDAATGRPAGPELRHAGDVMGACFTPEGRRVITVDDAGMLRFWDAQTGAPPGAALPTLAYDASALAFSPDDRTLVVPRKGGLQMLDAASGEPAGPTLTAPGEVFDARFSPDGRRVAGLCRSPTVYWWNLPSGQPGPPLQLSNTVRGIAFSPDGRSLAAITLEHLSVWDLARHELVWPAIQPGGHLFDVRFSPDGRSLATASWKGEARVFDAATGLPVGDSMRHRASVVQVRFSPDGRWLATASGDTTARLWNPLNGTPASPPLHHAGYVLNVNFNHDGSRVLTASQDHTVRLWDLPTNSPARLTLRHDGPVRRARFSPDGRTLLTSGFNRQARVSEAATGRELFSLRHNASLVEVAFSRDGQRIVTAGSDGSARVWSAASGVEIFFFTAHTQSVNHVEFSADGRFLLTASDDKTARVWNATNGAPVSPPLPHVRRVGHAEFSPDGRHVVTAADDRTAQVWDAHTGARAGEPMIHLCEVTHAAFSPDGQRVVTACSDRTQLPRSARVWDAATGRAITPPLRHIDGVFYAEFSPDGRFVASCGEDKVAIIWDAATGERLTPPLRHGAYVLRLAFSPDSRLLLTMSTDATARVWETATGEPVTSPLPHPAAVFFGAWSPDGREVVTAGEDGAARVWDVSPSSLSLEEWQRQAELLSANRLKPGLGAVPLSAREMQERWQALRGRK